jgi:mono/diheme cytochrome c family protein
MSNKSKRPWVAAVLLAVSASASASGEAVKRGETLHAQHCQRCHGNSLYTRADRKIHTKS